MELEESAYTIQTHTLINARGVAVDIETRRKKQRDLMVQLVERKVRSRAHQLYENRGQENGQELQDWFQAESEVLEKSILAPLYRRIRSSGEGTSSSDPTSSLTSQDSANCDTTS